MPMCFERLMQDCHMKVYLGIALNLLTENKQTKQPKPCVVFPVLDPPALRRPMMPSCAVLQRSSLAPPSPCIFASKSVVDVWMLLAITASLVLAAD